MTYELAHACGKDAANASMRAAGRTVWSQEDYNECCRVSNMLWTEEDAIQASYENFLAATKEKNKP